MNRRQAKKKLKKDYGVTPQEMLNRLIQVLSEDNLNRVVSTVVDYLNRLACKVEELGQMAADMRRNQNELSCKEKR